MAFSGFDNAWSWRLSPGFSSFTRTSMTAKRWYIISPASDRTETDARRKEVPLAHVAARLGFMSLVYHIT